MVPGSLSWKGSLRTLIPSCFHQGRIDWAFLCSSFAEKHVTSFQERFPFQALEVEMKFLVSHAGIGKSLVHLLELWITSLWEAFSIVTRWDTGSREHMGRSYCLCRQVLLTCPFRLARDVRISGEFCPLGWDPLRNVSLKEQNSDFILPVSEKVFKMQNQLSESLGRLYI